MSTWNEKSQKTGKVKHKKERRSSYVVIITFGNLIIMGQKKTPAMMTMKKGNINTYIKGSSSFDPVKSLAVKLGHNYKNFYICKN